jgi:mono/diheme cytochrome c family protein
MTLWNKETSLWLARAVAICTVFAMFVFSGGRVSADDAAKWVAPDDAKAVKNPLPATPENLAAGAQAYQMKCLLCHGEKGMGDGAVGKTLEPKPANFADAKMMSAETDGSLFWKITTGRGPMPSWKEASPEKERWQLVLYIRKLGAK